MRTYMQNSEEDDSNEDNEDIAESADSQHDASKPITQDETYHMAQRQHIKTTTTRAHSEDTDSKT